MSAKKKVKIKSWKQSVGVCLITVLTCFGVGLIGYMGMMSIIYEEPQADHEYLVYTDEEAEVESKEETLSKTTEAYCNIDGVNIRAEAATGTEIIGNLDEGDIVDVIDRYYSDEWIQVSFEGKVGYVYIEYLTFS